MRELGITSKLVKSVPESRNTPETLEQRIEFAQRYADLALPAVWIDESGWNLFMHRGKGRSHAGRPAVIVRPNAKGRNVTLIAAISEEKGLEAFEVRLGGTKRVHFEQFLRTVIAGLNGRGKHCIVMDNASIHHHGDIKSIVTSAGHELLHLPPYSPFLNPIETIFGVWKSRIKINRPSDHNSLIDQVKLTVTAVTADQVRRHARHTFRYLPRLLNREVIVFDMAKAAEEIEAPTLPVIRAMAAAQPLLDAAHLRQQQLEVKEAPRIPMAPIEDTAAARRAAAASSAAVNRIVSAVYGANEHLAPTITLPPIPSPPPMALLNSSTTTATSMMMR